MPFFFTIEDFFFIGGTFFFGLATDDFPLPNPGSFLSFFIQPHVAHILFLLSRGRGIVNKVRVRAASGLSLCFSRGLLLLA